MNKKIMSKTISRIVGNKVSTIFGITKSIFTSPSRMFFSAI